MVEAKSSPGLLTKLALDVLCGQTIHEASELMCGFDDGNGHASSDFPMAGNLPGRINPGQSLQPPKTSRHTDQLYADHAERTQRLQQKQELANFDRAERETLQRHVRRGNDHELGQVCERLYQDARRRRQDAIRTHIERQVHALGDNVVAAAHTGTPRWQELYDKGLQRRKKLDEKRQQLQEEEMQRLQAESLHSQDVGDETQIKVKEVIDRLTEDSRRRIKVQHHRAHMAKEEALRRQAEQQFCSLADLQDGINRLYYEDQQKRQEKFQQQIEALRDAQRAMLLSGSKVLSVEEANALCKQLYDDARRREEVRQQATERSIREEEETLREHSVHATVLQKHWQPAEVQEIFDRIANGRSSPPDSSDALANASLIVDIPTVVKERSCVTEVEADIAVLQGIHESIELADTDGVPRQLPEAHAMPPIAVSCSNQDVADAGAGPVKAAATLQMPPGKGHPRCRTATPLRTQRSGESGEETSIVPVPSKTVAGGLLPPPRGPPGLRRHEQLQETMPSPSSPLCGAETPEASVGENKGTVATSMAGKSRIHRAIKGGGRGRFQAAQAEVQNSGGRAATVKPRQPLTAVTPRKDSWY